MPRLLKRRALSIYLDYLMFTAAFHPVAYILDRLCVAQASTIASLAIFTVLRIALGLLLNRTPGEWALGIVSSENGRAVEPGIRGREAWWTIATGTLLVLEGSKNLVRWTYGLPPSLYFAGVADEVLFAATSAMGLLNMVAGLWILRTRAAGATLALGLFSVVLMSTLLGRDIVKLRAVEIITARRNLQGRPVREGELEFAQDFATSVIPGLIGVSIMVLVFVMLRFRQRDVAIPPAVEASTSGIE